MKIKVLDPTIIWSSIVDLMLMINRHFPNWCSVPVLSTFFCCANFYPIRFMRFLSELVRVSVVGREWSWQTSFGRQWFVIVTSTCLLSVPSDSEMSSTGSLCLSLVWAGVKSHPIMWLKTNNIQYIKPKFK